MSTPKKPSDPAQRVAIGYGRVSLVKQAQNGVSLDAQHEKFKCWCALHGYAYDPANWLHDDGISGKAMSNRPAFLDAVDRVCATKGVLVIYSISRAGRNLRETLDMAHRIEKAGADLCSLTESFDTSTASGRLVFAIFAALAAMEREQTGERTAAAMSHLRSIGRRTSKEPPYGYHLVQSGYKQGTNPPVPIWSVEPDIGEQTIIMLARSLRERQHLSLRDTAASLSSLGIFSRSGRPFCPSTIVAMLRQKAPNAARQEQP